MSIINRAAAELKGDRVIWAIVALLALFSILAVYSSSSMVAFQKRGGNTEFYLLKQVSLLTIGLIMTYAAYMLNYKRYSVWAPYMLAVVVPLLLLTLAIGPEINQAQRWLIVPGIGLSFQTSDLAKIALITYIARSITAKQDYIRDFQSAFVPIIMPIIIVCILIAPEDLSTAAVIFVTCMLMMFIGRVAVQYILLLIFCGLVSFAGLIVASKFLKEGAIRSDTWASRMRDFIENGDGQPQTQLAKMAIAKGGLFGNGPGNSIQKNYLPMAYTDYVYAVIIEEYGLIGAFLTLSLYVLLFLRVVRLVTKSPKTFPAMLAMGLCLILTIQALANMAVSVHLVPVMGLSMPMISMGGTSLLFSCISLGMILSVSKFIETEK